ncbi:hypothetical protein D6D85_05035 [Candidatus Methanodesulfokora washburnensis]|uniref:Uncharacterized protein n=2 Tax=Candidatus Methanodesulfokora washburnensis TaxID=2478471 RepID=A0A429GQP2_9CREN|nr:hypothetical protein D6D85_05035 [Candidatus Methanodesulfokores washburnensis]
MISSIDIDHKCYIPLQIPRHDAKTSRKNIIKETCKHFLMSLVKVAAGIGAVVVILLAVLVLYTATKPSLTVKSVEVTDVESKPPEVLGLHYPAIRILFKTDKYPVKFYLMTPEGDMINSYEAKLPEETAYLAIGKPWENIVGSRSYVVKAFIEEKEVFRREVNVKGLSGSARVLNVSIGTELYPNLSGVKSIPEPVINKILIEVENSGDVPLYLSSSVLSADGNPLVFKPSKVAIMPGSREKVELSIPWVIYLDKRHVFTVSIPGIGNSSYTAEPLRPEVRVESVGLRPNYIPGLRNAPPVGYFLDNVTITVRNTEAYPISFLHNFEVYVGDKKAIVFPPDIFLNPGEERTLTITCDLYVEKKPSEVRVKLYGTEVAYQVP